MLRTNILFYLKLHAEDFALFSFKFQVSAVLAVCNVSAENRIGVVDAF